MIKSKIIILGFVVLILASCNSAMPNNKPIYCGYELTVKEYNKLRTKVESQKSAYTADSIWNIYDQLNDSIRSAMPDSVEFEIFLSLLNIDEVGIDIIVPNNKEFFEIIGCAIMSPNYKGRMPVQRYMCLYTYTSADGSGDSPLGVAIKRKN